MIKILLIIFILIPFSIWIGTMIANLFSIILMIVAVTIGGFTHKLFRGKSVSQWQPPDYLQALQFIVIYGLIASVYASVIGGAFNWSWLLHIGIILRSVFAALLVIDLLALIVLSTIHGPFDLMGE